MGLRVHAPLVGQLQVMVGLCDSRCARSGKQHLTLQWWGVWRVGGGLAIDTTRHPAPKPLA